MPKGLLEALSALLTRSASSKPKIEETRIDRIEARERSSLLKLVCGMSVGGYGYDPRTERSSIPKDIRSDLNRLGLDLTEDTIRKWLKEAMTVQEQLKSDPKADKAK